MSDKFTQLSDIIVPELFSSEYYVNKTLKGAPLVGSGVITVSPVVSLLMQGGGNSLHIPFFNDLDDTESRVSSDTIPFGYTNGVNPPDPISVTQSEQLAVKIFRNQSWGSTSLAGQLAMHDPVRAIMDRISAYWSRQLDALAMDVIKGVVADNDAAPTSDEHVQSDLTYDISGNAFDADVTSISATAVLNARNQLGSNYRVLDKIIMHPDVLTKLAVKNLIQTIPDARGEVNLQSYMGMQVIVSDSLPAVSGVYETWLAGSGLMLLGSGSTPKPLEVEWISGAGNGGGAEIVYSRQVWCLHPNGFKYAGVVPKGGPTNVNLRSATSWERVYKDRAQIPFVRLVTRES